MDKLLENISNWTVKTIGVMALLGSAWNGSPIGQAVNPYFIKAPAIVEQVSNTPKPDPKTSKPDSKTSKPNCEMIDGRKMCASK